MREKRVYVMVRLAQVDRTLTNLNPSAEGQLFYTLRTEDLAPLRGVLGRHHVALAFTQRPPNKMNL